MPAGLSFGKRLGAYRLRDDENVSSSAAILGRFNAVNPASVLVLKPSSLGDVVHTLPAVSRMKAAWPSARFSWLVNPEWAPLLEGNPDLDEIVLFPRHEGFGRVARWLRGEIMQRKPDLAVDFQGLLRTSLIGRLSGARILLGAGDAREGASRLYHRTVPALGGVPHAVERYLALADATLGSAAPPKDEPLRYPLPVGTPPENGGALAEGFVLLHPFSRGEGKSLSVNHVRAICEQLAPRPVVLAGRAEAVGDLPLPANTVNFLNRTSLGELIWLLRRAGFVISVDSGPMHLAAALNRPLVSIHFWSDPRRVGPYRPDAWVWKHGHLLRAGELAAQLPAWFDRKATAFSDKDIFALCALATE